MQPMPQMQQVPHPPHPDEVRTIFISGFPGDMKDRELNNLLQFLPGYEASPVRLLIQSGMGLPFTHHIGIGSCANPGKSCILLCPRLISYATCPYPFPPLPQASQLFVRESGSTQGFALFHTGEFARQAVSTLHNLRFDERAVLRVEMARKNMYAGLRENEPGMPGYDPTAPPGAAGQLPSRPGYGGGALPYPSPGSAHGGPGGYPAKGYGSTGGSTPRADRDNPACNTLFVGSLSEAVSEEELTTLFGWVMGRRRGSHGGVGVYIFCGGCQRGCRKTSRFVGVCASAR
jgi:hypothetical protein